MTEATNNLRQQLAEVFSYAALPSHTQPTLESATDSALAAVGDDVAAVERVAIHPADGAKPAEFAALESGEEPIHGHFSCGTAGCRSDRLGHECAAKDTVSQKPENFAGCHVDNSLARGVMVANTCPDCGERNPADVHTCSPQKAAPSAEAVAYIVRHADPSRKDTRGMVIHADEVAFYQRDTLTRQPLYAAPQPDSGRVLGLVKSLCAKQLQLDEARAEVERLRDMLAKIKFVAEQYAGEYPRQVLTLAYAALAAKGEKS